MAEIILKTNLRREKGFLYPTGTSEDGFIVILKVKPKNRVYKSKEIN